MNMKIGWYREVLELEPDSRLFLPLARLLCIGEYLCNILFLPIVKVRIKSA